METVTQHQQQDGMFITSQWVPVELAGLPVCTSPSGELVYNLSGTTAMPMEQGFRFAPNGNQPALCAAPPSYFPPVPQWENVSSPAGAPHNSFMSQSAAAGSTGGSGNKATDGPSTTTTTTKSTNPRRTLTDADRRRMCLYHEENPNVKQTEIGAMFGVERRLAVYTPIVFNLSTK